MAGGPSLMDSLFQRSLDDLIKGLRLSPPVTKSTFISKSLDDIRREIKSTDPQNKSVALQKLTYLHSLHSVDMSWASFHCVELSSSSAHSHKRIAFLSAALSFNPSTTDVILLLTHQLRKDLSSTNPHDVSLALSTLSSICNVDLARDLTPELFTLLSSSKLFVRKKAIAAVLRVFEQYPDAVRVCFKRVVENLENADMGILSSVVGLFCEITVKEPKSYLPLAPEFYKILVDCRNNWVLIKVLKIFAKLAPLEPRLGKRVVEPICKHMERTGAKSLAFECIKTIVTSLSEHESAVKLAVGKMREFLLEDDLNLKYLGLQALSIVAEKHMWAVFENKKLVVNALSDVDVNIRLEALRLVMSMVSEDNVMEICRILISHTLKSEPEFCNEILDFILLTCSKNFYEIIIDFDWYVSFLGEMARIPHCQKGEEIGNQLVDIGMRVKDARNELVRVARDLVIDPALLGTPFIHEVLAAAAWIPGEYVEFSRNPYELMEALLQPRTSLLPPSIKAVYIQSAFKVLSFCLYSYLNLNGDVPVSKNDTQGSLNSVESKTVSDSENVVITHTRMNYQTQESIRSLINLVETNVGPLARSSEVEVQERASNVIGLINLMKPKILGCLDQSEGNEIHAELKASEIIKMIHEAFSEDLGPVALNSQERVPKPEGLVLKENLSELDAICGDIMLPLLTSFSLVKPRIIEKNIIPEGQSREESEPLTESISLLAEHRKRHGIYYLPSESKETVSNEYPPAHDPTNKAIDNAEDLVKLTEQSLVLKRKPAQVKLRPVVVTLDEGPGLNVTAKKPEVKADLISGAVQEVILGSSFKSKSPNKSSKNKEMGELKDNITINDDMAASLGRRKHHIHGKEQKHQSSGKEKENGHKNKQKSDSRHGKHKFRQKADSELATQSSVIPDFLL